MHPVVDLHCDLLSFLAENSSHQPDDPKSNASFSQMKAGGIALQTLAIFTDGSSTSFEDGKKQLFCLEKLLENKGQYELFHFSSKLQKKDSILVIPAFENASGFCPEGASLEKALIYLDSVLKRFHHLLYISLTWDDENRFGGGNRSKVGLKEDGKIVLEWMHEKKIAIDLSHTSDFLSDDILNYIDKKSLHVPVIASHSNCRSIHSKERNLPDLFLKEIIARKGLIGLNFFAPFIGEKPEDILLHVQHLLDLKGEDSICFGADFFPSLVASYVQQKYNTTTCFFKELGNSSCYPRVFSWLKKSLSPKDDLLEKIGSKNFINYLKKLNEC